jgi:hypothetical protein
MWPNDSKPVLHCINNPKNKTHNSFLYFSASYIFCEYEYAEIKYFFNSFYVMWPSDNKNQYPIVFLNCTNKTHHFLWHFSASYILN